MDREPSSRSSYDDHSAAVGDATVGQNLPLEQRHACQEAAQRQSEPAGGQAATTASPSEPLQHKPPTEERILMMDYAATRARSEGALLPTPTVDGVW
jgi:hypothetical protein